MKEKLLVAGSSLVALLVIGIVVLLVLRGKSPPVSDADLKFTRVNISSNENAFFILEQAGENLSWPEETNKEVSALFEWNSWNKDLSEDILSDNTKCLELIDKAILCPALQVPEIQNFDEDYKYFTTWKDLSRLSLLRSIALFHEGKENEAVHSTLQIVHIGHKMEGSGGVPLHYLVGSAVKNLALHTFQEMIGHTSLSCEVTRDYLGELDQLYANKLALTNAVKMEYRLQNKMIHDMATGKYNGLTNANAQSITAILYNPLLNAEKTRDYYALFARTRLKSIECNYSNMPTNPVVFSTNQSTFQLWVSGNAIGRILAQLSAPSQKFVARKCRENVTVSATQTLLAMKCYKMKYGALPKTLSDLVPEFLSAVPLDDFDGKPLRYSAEKKIIYSVGVDLIDSGGQGTNSVGKTLDIPFKIEF